jgi:hypothetical protein
MKAAWEWAKKYWELLVGALLLLLGVLFGVALQRRSAPVQQPNPVKDEADKEAEAKTREAENKAADEKAEAVKEHDADLAVVVQKAQETTAEVRGDTQKTNDYLQQVSKSVRGDP